MSQGKQEEGNNIVSREKNVLGGKKKNPQIQKLVLWQKHEPLKKLLENQN